MPEFKQEEEKHFKIIVHFPDDNAVNTFSELVGQKITEKTKYIWFPKQEDIRQRDYEYVTDTDADTDETE